MFLYGGDVLHDAYHDERQPQVPVTFVCVEPVRYSYLSIFAF